MSGLKLRWKTDFEKQVLIQNFEKRGWVRCNGEGMSERSLTSLQTTGMSTGPTFGRLSKFSTLKLATGLAKPSTHVCAYP